MSAINIEVGSATLHVHEQIGHGSAGCPSPVFLHYFGGSGRTWEPVMDALVAAGWHCLAPDQCGCGESPAPGEDSTHYTVDTMADDIRGLIDRLRLKRFIVVTGQSSTCCASTRPKARRRSIAFHASHSRMISD